MKLADIELCTGCKACVEACPVSAISFNADDEGFHRPAIDGAKCVRCEKCEKTCPVLHRGGADNNPTCYIARAKDKGLRLACSSGALSDLLAREIIKDGGCVFGCVMEPETMSAIHQKITTVDGLGAMRGSKYVQSDLRGTLSEAKRELDSGRFVMYVGTPCQVAGLKAFLGKPYDNLATISFMCHGVPSPAVLAEYIRQVERWANSHVRRISFRSKICSWRRCALSLDFANDKAHRSEFTNVNPYMRAFLGNLCLRPSCYQCPFKEGREGADITLADCWGVLDVAPEMDDDMGVSSVLIHSVVGRKLLKRIEGVLDIRSVTYRESLVGNTTYIHSSPCPDGRGYFMTHFKSVSMRSLVDFLLEGPWYRRYPVRAYYRTRCLLGTIRRKVGLRK